jgi:hypothetical protein
MSALLLCGVVLAKDKEIFLSHDAYLTYHIDQTWYWNSAVNGSACSEEDFDLSLLVEALDLIYNSRHRELDSYPDAVGVRVEFFYRVTGYDNQGNSSTSPLNFLVAEIPLAALLAINSGFATEISNRTTWTGYECPGGFFVRVLPSAELSPLLRVFFANRGSLFLNSRYYSLSVGGAFEIP